MNRSESGQTRESNQKLSRKSGHTDVPDKFKSKGECTDFERRVHADWMPKGSRILVGARR
jgi:hypothetical protein